MRTPVIGSMTSSRGEKRSLVERKCAANEAITPKRNPYLFLHAVHNLHNEGCVCVCMCVWFSHWPKPATESRVV